MGEELPFTSEGNDEKLVAVLVLEEQNLALGWGWGQSWS